MTTPVVTPVAPLNNKAWVSLASDLATLVIPLILGVLQYIPANYAWISAIVIAVVGLLRALGIYRVSNTPEGTVLVPESQVQTLPADVPYTPVPDLPVASRSSAPSRPSIWA